MCSNEASKAGGSARTLVLKAHSTAVAGLGPVDQRCRTPPMLSEVA